MRIKFKNILALVAFASVVSFESTASNLDKLIELESSLDANCGSSQHYVKVIDPPSVSPLTFLIAGRNFNKLEDDRCVNSVNKVISDFSSNIDDYNIHVNVTSEVQNQKQFRLLVKAHQIKQKQFEVSNLSENTRLILL